MPTQDPFKKMKEERKKQTDAAMKKLKEYQSSKITFQRPAFFVPGWTDESCKNWVDPYKKSLSIKEWFGEITTNSSQAYFVIFSEDESKLCNSFFDFGQILKNKIESTIGNNAEFDIVGHSMGGLDIRSAVAMQGLKNIRNCITVATPHKGSQWGDLGPKIKDYAPHHVIQCINLDPDHIPIQMINRKENRENFLRGIDKLYQLVGTRDMAVMRNAKIDIKNLNSTLCEKIATVEIGGVSHSAKDGITRDVRSVVAIANILVGIEPEKPKLNYGYVCRK